MFSRSLTVLLAATAIAAWPIAFYPTLDCKSDPVLVLDEPPKAGACGLFHDHVKSYSGGTEDEIQKVLIYYDSEVCLHDAAHRVYSNHTINNNENKCIPFNKDEEVPLAFTYIEEILPTVAPNCSDSYNRLVVQF